jgi:DNA-binding FadR family transcriptional regulator
MNLLDSLLVWVVRVLIGRVARGDEPVNRSSDVCSLEFGTDVALMVRYGAGMSERSAGGSEPRGRLTPVVRKGLTDRVIDQLRQRIADGTWPLGQRLPVESALAKELGVGRSTVREAVRVLAHAGMLEVRQGDGTFVRSRREIDAALRKWAISANLIEAFEIRRALEIEAARLAAQRRSDADVVRLRDLAKRRADAYRTSSLAYRKADIALREFVVEATGSVLLTDMYQGFVTPLREAIDVHFDDAEMTSDDPGRPETDELIQAIENRDPKAAAAAAERHMDNAMRVLRFLVQVVIVGR